MKTFSTAACAAVASILFVGCSSSHSDPPVPVNDGKVKITAVIGDIISRVTESNWENGDCIGVSDNKGNKNVAYTTSGDVGAFDSPTGIHLTGDDHVFTAYYPYSSSNSSGIINISVADNNFAPRPTKEIDFLYAPTAGATRLNPVVRFEFVHKMARVAFKIIDSDGILTSGSQLSVTIDKIATTGAFNTLTGEIVPGEKTGKVTRTVTPNVESEFILPAYPTSSPNTERVPITVSVLNGSASETYTGSILPALVESRQYNYTLTLTYGSQLKVTSSSITGWTQEENEDVNLVRPDQKEDGDPSQSISAEVGDYLLKDGTILPQANLTSTNKSNVVGVVFYAGHDLTQYGFPKNNGLAIALENAGEDKFGTIPDDAETYLDKAQEFPSLVSGKNLSEMDVRPETIGSVSGFLGYNNTAIIKALKDEANYSGTLLSLLEENGPEWYLPSFGEFKTIFSNLSKINASIEKVGGEGLKSFNNSTLISSEFYWTSTLNGQRKAWVCVFDNSISTSNLSIERCVATKKGIFRFAIAF